MRGWRAVAPGLCTATRPPQNKAQNPQSAGSSGEGEVTPRAWAKQNAAVPMTTKMMCPQCTAKTWATKWSMRARFSA